MQEKSSGFQWPAQWTPDILATLMFVVQKGRILLIRKKRGIGAGKVNGPGGKFEPGETALQCVLREVREELHEEMEELKEHGHKHEKASQEETSSEDAEDTSSKGEN